MITITDAVDLIIDKKVRELNELVSSKKEAIDSLKEEIVEEGIENIKKIFSENFDEENIKIFVHRFLGGGFMDNGYMMGGGGFIRRIWDSDNSYFSQHIYSIFYDCGLRTKENEEKSKKLYTLQNELDNLYTQIHNIKNSKTTLITEVTLQHLSSIDIDFNDKIDEVVKRIFQTEPKLLN